MVGVGQAKIVTGKRRISPASQRTAYHAFREAGNAKGGRRVRRSATPTPWRPSRRYRPHHTGLHHDPEERRVQGGAESLHASLNGSVHLGSHDVPDGPVTAGGGAQEAAAEPQGNYDRVRLAM